jgi:hypothetical protein
VQEGAPAAEEQDGTSFMRKPAAAVVAGINTEEVFVPIIPKSDATLAMLENAVKGTLPQSTSLSYTTNPCAAHMLFYHIHTT